MAKEPTVIRFKGPIHQIKTMVDGGVNVTLSLSGDDTRAITALFQCKQPGVVLEVAAVPVKIAPLNAKAENVEKKTRKRQRYPYRDA